MLFLKSLPFWWSWRWGCSPLCHPPCLQCLPFGLMPSRSLHFVYILSMLRASTWHELPCWVKKWCWCALPTRMNCYKSNSVPSVFAILCSHTQQASSIGQQPEPLHRAVQVFFPVLLNFWRIKSWSVFSRGMWSVFLQTQRSWGSYRTQHTSIAGLGCLGL